MSSLFMQTCECRVHLASREAADKERTRVWVITVLDRP